MSSIDDAYFVGRSIFIHTTPKDGENQKHSNYCQFFEMFQWWGFLQSSLEYIQKKKISAKNQELMGTGLHALDAFR